jgi:hypothetical protein
MSRFDTSNIDQSNKMYSVIGTDLSNADELVQNGMVGKIGDRIVDDIYEFLPLEDGDTDVFFLATPEVDPDETSILNNSLHGFKLALGQVADAIQYKTHNKFAIEEDGVEGIASNAHAVKGAYLYSVGGKRKLQYKTTKPDAVTDKPIQIYVIEDVVPATQGMYLKQGTASSRSLTPIQLQYNMIRCRVL